MDNAIGMIYRYKMPRECRFHFLFWILASAAISAFFCGCGNDFARAAYRPAPHSSPASIYRARLAEYATMRAQKEFEAATAAATRTAPPPAPQRVEAAPPPAPIAPIAKPLPAF